MSRTPGNFADCFTNARYYSCVIANFRVLITAQKEWIIMMDDLLCHCEAGIGL